MYCELIEKDMKAFENLLPSIEKMAESTKEWIDQAHNKITSLESKIQKLQYNVCK